MKKKVLYVVLVVIVLVAGYFGIKFYNDAQVRHKLNVEIYKQSLTWVNPEPQLEAWQNGIKSKEQNGLWTLAKVDGAGEVKDSPWHAANINLVTNTDNAPYLSLEVTHDPDFDKESNNTPADVTMSHRYNNAFVIGMEGWLPKPAVDGQTGSKIVAEFKARWPLGEKSYGSSGVWFEKQGTFAASGKMAKDFQSAGLSWLGKNSIFMSGLNIEGVTQIVPNAISEVKNVKMAEWSTFVMSVKWKDQDNWIYTIKVDDGPEQEITVNPIGPMEIQIWKDNYYLTFNLMAPFEISYENIPENVVDQFQVKEIKVYEQAL
jgi:hypothetical protein